MQKLIINYALTDLNTYINAERANRYKAAKLKKEATEMCMWEAMQQLKKIKTPAIFEFTWICKNKKKDPDNISFAQKFLFDGLVESGKLENDGHKQIKKISHEFEFRNYDGLEVKIIENCF